MTATEPKPAPDKASKLLPILLVPVAAGVWLASRTAYYEGFAKSLGIPDSISVTPGITVSSAIFEFTFIFFLLNGIIVLSQSLGLVKLAKHPVVQNILVTLLLTLLFGGGGLAVLLKQWPNPLASGFGILLLALCIFFAWLIWLFPLTEHSETAGYPAKLRKQKEQQRRHAAKIADNENEPWDLTNLLHSIGGRSAGLVLLAFIFLPTTSYHLGQYVGGSRTEWLVVESQEIPGDKTETWIVLGEEGERLLIAPTRGNLIINRYRLISSSSAIFQRRELGELDVEALPERNEKQ